jgi:transposase-like protein
MTKILAKVQEHKDLVRDMESKAVLNVDQQALLEHRRKKRMMTELLTHGSRIDRIENDVSEIKQMLKQLLTK